MGKTWVKHGKAGNDLRIFSILKIDKKAGECVTISYIQTATFGDILLVWIRHCWNNQLKLKFIQHVATLFWTSHWLLHYLRWKSMTFAIPHHPKSLPPANQLVVDDALVATQQTRRGFARFLQCILGLKSIGPNLCQKSHWTDLDTFDGLPWEDLL